MAKYNREFLVPYLRDVCALELAKWKLYNRGVGLQESKKKLQAEHTVRVPQEPDKTKIYTVGVIFFFVVGLLTFAAGAAALSWIKEAGIAWLFLGAVMLIGSVCCMWSRLLKNSEKQDDYAEAWERYEIRAENASNELSRKILPVQKEIQRCDAELEKVNKTLLGVYSANIIPGHYRNRYVAVFLYDWFSTSQADDLDAALNMFVLEEIKDRLDKIIRNQGEMILNQCITIANQRRSLEAQNAHNRMMQEKLDRIIASDEERNLYLNMMEKENAATAYFVAADYIRRI